MSKQPRSQSLVAARAALENLLNYDAFLEKLSPKDRLNVTRHVEACEATGDPRHALLWRRLASALMTLAPHFAKTDGQQRIRFFVPDGQYRMQVFAMEDLRDGVISIYCGDALDEAIAAGLVAPTSRPALTWNRGSRSTISSLSLTRASRSCASAMTRTFPRCSTRT